MKNELLDLILNSVFLGVGATISMDFWALMLQRFIGIAPLNYALVGRWLIHMSKGTFCHVNIATAKPVTAELVVGWAAHYLTGVVFAAVLIMLVGNEWINTPRLIPAITFGILTVGIPFFIMQPCMGFGIAASKAPKPNLARFRSLVTHFIFGLGLFLSATLNSFFLVH
ncbi:DUF2938 domain-containing protein [Colwellia psychrerythraea]|uniref:DUF2938 domain-containing protein n=1 Tax=Colwellia psychrerythraea TaxID=28229 RepID=A0A099KSF4_COLPS|nr:DUF2938 domain-containing protein [Colwellia psychrerythraea]KGJ92817.1 Protein of unknown function DUF2938 [Colwellia psychrerythraea]